MGILVIDGAEQSDRRQQLRRPVVESAGDSQRRSLSDLVASESLAQRGAGPFPDSGVALPCPTAAGGLAGHRLEWRLVGV